MSSTVTLNSRRAKAYSFSYGAAGIAGSKDYWKEILKRVQDDILNRSLQEFRADFLSHAFGFVQRCVAPMCQRSL